MLAPVFGIQPGKQQPAVARSRLGVSLNVPNQLVERALGRYAPVVVAKERNMPAGAAGRTSFEIRRGEPRIETTEGGLTVMVKLTGEIHLCKPFGGVCIEYGMCRPEWTAQVFARSPWQVRDEPDVSLNVDITKGCVLSPVKVDVTSELKKVTDAEVAKIRKQLTKEVRRFHRSLQKQLEGSAALQPTPGECLTFAVDTLGLALNQEDDHYSLDVEVSGQPGWDCNATPRQEQARLVTHPELTPQTVFHVDSRVDLDALSAEWQRRIPNQQLRVTPHADELLVEVAGWQGCASGWVVFRPSANGATVTFDPTASSDPALATLLGTPEILADAGVAHRARAMRLMPSLLQPLGFDSELLVHPLVLQASPQLSGRDRAFVEPDAVVLRTTVQGTVSGNLTEKR